MDSYFLNTDLLPGLDNYLRNELAQERLSLAAEKRRKYYVTRLEAFQANPPNPPPKPAEGKYGLFAMAVAIMHWS